PRRLSSRRRPRSFARPRTTWASPAGPAASVPTVALRERRSRLTRRRALAGVIAVSVALLLAVVVANLGSDPPVVETLPSVAAADPAFAATLEAQLGTPVVAGNRAALLLNGDEIFPAKLAAIRAARTSITYAEYFWAAGDVA